MHGKMSILEQIKIFVKLNFQLWIAKRRAIKIECFCKRLNILITKEEKCLKANKILKNKL